MRNILLHCSILFLTNSAFSHGEDKLGPNNGFVRMPGAFHTEIVVTAKNKVKVYLLDIDWRNPSVLKSEVKASLINAKMNEDVVCSAKKIFFLCTFSINVNLKQIGELQIAAIREEQKGGVAIYKLPLKLEKSTPMPNSAPEEKIDHSSHH